jgi:hypothetical protein
LNLRRQADKNARNEKVSSISRLQHHIFPPAFSPAKLKETFFSLREHLEFYLVSAQSDPSFLTLKPLTRHVTFKLERSRAHHSHNPNSFLAGQQALHIRWY